MKILTLCLFLKVLLAQSLMFAAESSIDSSAHQIQNDSNLCEGSIELVSFDVVYVLKSQNIRLVIYDGLENYKPRIVLCGIFQNFDPADFSDKRIIYVSM